jgi:hypothetical protein
MALKLRVVKVAVQVVILVSLTAVVPAYLLDKSDLQAKEDRDLQLLEVVGAR